MQQTAFSLQFIGTGNSVSKPPRNYNNNVILRVGGRMCLLDCGLLCPLGMHALGIPLTSVDAVMVSHLHGDHVLGLEELLFTNYFGMAGRRVPLYLPTGLTARGAAPQGYDIWENCLRASLETTVEADSGSRILGFDDYADVHVMQPRVHYDVCGLDVEIFAVRHVKYRPAYGFIFNGSVAFTADCAFSRKRIDLLLESGVHTIFHDVQFSPFVFGVVHATFDELATLPPEIAQHIVLMHYNDSATIDDFKRAEDFGFRIARSDTLYAY